MSAFINPETMRARIREQNQRIAELEVENELLSVRLRWLIKAAEPLAMEEVVHPPFNGQMRTTWNAVTKLRSALYLAKNPKANCRDDAASGEGESDE